MKKLCIVNCEVPNTYEPKTQVIIYVNNVLDLSVIQNTLQVKRYCKNYFYIGTNK